jgi:hypothetical protein
MAKIAVTLVHDRETKNTFRYREVDSNNRPIINNREAQIGVIYIKKEHIAGDPPDYITATIDIPGGKQ